jgi:hypothetical protein
MIYDIEIKSNQFVLLGQKPYAWQVLVPTDVGLVRGDMIRYLELDSFNVLTGAALLGFIDCVGSGDMLVNEGSSVYAYCSVIGLGLGSGKVGSSLMVG